MSEFEVSIDVEGSEYGDVIIIEKYGDAYSLVLGQHGQDGKLYKRWAFRQTKDRKPADKATPVKLPLGNLVIAHRMVDRIKAALPPLPKSNAATAATAASVMGGRVVDDDIQF